ncbi:MAG: cytochrome c3 family protein, partial [Nitrospiraceae bacterium]
DGVSYDWQVRTVDDSSANSSWVAFAGTPDFTVDQTAPSYTWNTPSASTWYKDTDNISVDATITESGVGITNGANCNPKIDGASSSFSGSVTYSTGSGKCTGTLTLGNPSSLTNGAHNLTVEVADDLGNTQQSANRSINIDNSAPTGLSNSTPADTATGQATNVNVVANTASDSDSGSVQYLFEVAEDSGFSVGLQQSGWQAGTSYAPTLAVSTTYYWHVKAKDSVGNETAYTTTWSFTTSTPTVNPDDPANLAQYRSDGSTPIASGNYTEEATVVIEADINDADGGDTIKLQVDLDNNGSVDCEEAGYGANPRTNVQVTCSVSNGVSYDWRVRAQDNNSANSNWVAFAGSPDFISDQAAPGYAWNTPAAGSYYKDGDNISVDVTVTETGIGITNGASCNPKIDGAATEFTGSVTYSTGSGKCTGTLTIDDPSGLTDAAHNLTVEVADNVGNTQQSAPRSINIDNAAPTGLNNSSPANSATDQSISVNVVANAASDSGSGSVQYYFEVAENSGFSVGLQQSGWQPGTSYAPTLAVSTTYYWHVAATDAVGNITAYTATWDFTTGTAANPPDAPSDHNQYRNDGTTLIAQGGSINGTTIKIKATVSDPDTDDTKLEVEILDNGSGYTGTPNCSSDYVTSGSVATAVCTGLSDGIAYKWRARTNDGTDQSAWQIFGGSDPDVTITLDGQFDISACSHCHSAPPADGSLRDTPEGAVIGSHGVTEHDAANCGNCHVEPGAAEYDHRNENIEMTATIHAQTGSSYSKGTSFVQTNSPTLGTCSATYCHGTGSDTWGTDLSAYDTCTKCHGEKTASPTDPQKAPGGSGVDTNNDSSNLDAEVGAHQVHLTAADNISSAIACGECHNVPSSPSDAGHWDTSGARDAAELTFNGPIGDTDGLDNPLTITYSSSQCSNTYCHDGRNFKNGWSTAAQIDSDFETPTWNKPIISGDETVYGGDGNICNNCHGYPPAGSHDPSTDCSGCHDHVDLTDDGFTGVNIAKHINHIVEAQAECITCHNGVPNGASYVTRDIVGSDFTQSYRHVFGGTVTNWDCIVCHREGDATAASTGTVGTTALHGNGGTPVVDMRNVDSISTGWVWDKNNITNAMHTDMDTFCMGCHDSDGASGINVKATDDGVNLSNARALTPFNSTDDVSQGTGGGTANVAGYERTAVLDVFTQFDTTNPSHHAVRGQAYTSHNANWGDTAWVDRTLKDGTRLITDNIYESAQLHCADCHTTDQNAHGGASGFMLQASSIDGTCYLCHNIATYDDVSSSDTRWDHSNDGGVWDTGKGSKLGLYGANAGSICLNCHGGNPVTDGFGGIHGLPAGSDPRSSQQRYRFQGGSYMSYSPSSWTGTSGGTPTCYFDATTDTQPWSNCTQHGGSGSETETGRTADPQYSRGVPGDY